MSGRAGSPARTIIGDALHRSVRRQPHKRALTFRRAEMDVYRTGPLPHNTAGKILKRELHERFSHAQET
ncbi:MAG: hypothetical protein AB1511_02420 [Deinococcota bacterium]